MELKPVVQDVLKMVEQETGKPVRLIHEPKLAMDAQVKVARPKMESHLLFYKSHSNLSHKIAHECGRIIRIVSSPDKKKIIPATTKGHFDALVAEVKQRSSYLNLKIEDSIYEYMVNGYITQLMSMPMDVWVENWIYKNFTDLHEEQKNTLNEQYMSASSLCNPNAKATLPFFILKKSLCITSACFKKFDKDLNLGMDLSVIKKTVLKDDKTLFSILESSTYESYMTDKQMILDFEKELNTEWIEWRDFDIIPDDYETSVLLNP